MRDGSFETPWVYIWTIEIGKIHAFGAKCLVFRYYHSIAFVVPPGEWDTQQWNL